MGSHAQVFSQENEVDKRGVSTGRSSGNAERNRNGLSLTNQNIIYINII